MCVYFFLKNTLYSTTNVLQSLSINLKVNTECASAQFFKGTATMNTQ